MNQYELKNAFRNGTRVYGTLITSPSPKMAAQYGKTGADFVFIDCEHMPINRSDRAFMCQTYSAMGFAPIVRIPYCNAYEAFSAMEDGAAGIVCPYVESPDEVKILAGAVKYRPLKGEKLKKVLDGSIKLTDREEKYLSDYNKGCLLLLNIESVPAVDNIDTLLDCPGVDGVLIGPHDLSINMGIPEEYDAPEFERAVERVIVACRERNMGVGNHYSGSLIKQIQWAKKGMSIVVWSSDISRFVQAISADFNEVRKALGEKDGNEATADVTI